MLKLILGTDWKVNTDKVFRLLADDVANQRCGRILLVPETISHNAERTLCEYAGDTASRFAEVLSFSRLPDRLRDAEGIGLADCMDNGGRVVSMAAAAIQLHSKLKAYASVETRPEFLINLLEAVDEFKCCCIQPSDLMAASGQSEGSLAQKLEELALLLETYEGICKRGKRDPRDRLSWLLEQLEDSSFAENRVFYFNGFTDFTGQQLAIIRHLILSAETVVVALNCDKPGSGEPAFEKAGETAMKLLRFAEELGVSTQIENTDHEADSLAYLRGKLFKGHISQQPELAQCVRVYQAESVADECDSAAQIIMERVRGGARYRDIRVVCTDISTYKNALEMSFARYGIPLYLSGTEDILDMPVINTVLAALEAATCGFEQRSVMRYLHSYLSPLELETCDQVENYAFMWNIRGDRWKKEWTNHPAGLGVDFDEASMEKLHSLNAARILAISPLMNLENGFRKAANLKDQVVAVYQFLEEISLANRLEQMAELASKDGEVTLIQVFGQLWEILVCALEQLHDALGDSRWDTENFVKLLKLLLSQYDVGTIPPVLDAVSAGSIASMRFQDETHLIILGAGDGNLPSYGKSTGVLTEQERAQLRLLGVPLTGGMLEGLQSEIADIYNIFCGTTQTITVSCPSGQPSYIYKRLIQMTGRETPVSKELGAAECNPYDACAYVLRNGSFSDLERLPATLQARNIIDGACYKLGSVSEEGVGALYGNNLHLSASKIDLVADCRMAYFLKYGIKAKERKEATIDPAEFGTYVHDVLEHSAREIKDLGGFHKVTLEQTLEIANRYAKQYAESHFSQIDSDRLNYLFQRNTQELEEIVTELWEELQNCSFEPSDFELGFGADGKMDYIHFNGKKMHAQLEGKVDRVDIWNNGHQNYFRVVDYKTGAKDFDYCDVFNGIGLQMFLYMFALEENGQQVLGEHAVPAGVQYFPARVPTISTDGASDQEDVKEERIKKLKRKGLVLQDDDVLYAMESLEKPLRMQYSRRKDGTTSGNLADRSQMRLLKHYIFALLSRFVDDIASGCVAANPYTRGDSHNACRFCPYGAICHPLYVEGRRNFKEMSAQWFWESVEKEVGKHG